jgi:type IV pilus assembly protein PilN
MIAINLLPVRETRKKETERKQALVLGGVMAGTFAAILMVHVAISRRIAGVNEEIRTTQAEIDKLAKQIGDVQKFKKDKADIERKLTVIRQLEANRGGPVHLLDELASRLPERIWLTKLQEQGGVLTLEGLSIDNETIATYMTRLAQSPYLKNIELERSQLQEGAVKLNEFTIRCEVVTPPAA